MSTPVDQLQPPPLAMVQQAYTARSGHGSIGSVIAVLAVITILGVIAGMIGRLCSGRPIMGRGQYDFEGWVERKCASCLDGRMDPPPVRPAEQVVVAAEEEDAAADPQEKKEEEQGREQGGTKTAGSSEA